MDDKKERRPGYDCLIASSPNRRTRPTRKRSRNSRTSGWQRQLHYQAARRFRHQPAEAPLTDVTRLDAEI